MFDQPFVRPSPLQAIDPRVRLALAALTAVCLALLQNLTACWLGLALGTVLLAVARPPLLPLLRRLATVNLFILFLWCVTPWTTPGAVLAQWGIFAVSVEGVRLSLLVSIKSNAIVCVFLALVANMDSPTVGHAMERLCCPRKLVFLFLFTGRYVHVLATEWQTLNVAGSACAALRRAPTCTPTAHWPPCWVSCWYAATSALRVREAMLLRGLRAVSGPWPYFAPAPWTRCSLWACCSVWRALSDGV